MHESWLTNLPADAVVCDCDESPATFSGPALYHRRMHLTEEREGPVRWMGEAGFLVECERCGAVISLADLRGDS